MIRISSDQLATPLKSMLHSNSGEKNNLLYISLCSVGKNEVGTLKHLETISVFLKNCYVAPLTKEVFTVAVYPASCV